MVCLLVATVLSFRLIVWEWQQLMSTPKKYHFKNKKLKNPNNKNSFIDVLESDH